jgi:hypothetical protein
MPHRDCTKVKQMSNEGQTEVEQYVGRYGVGRRTTRRRTKDDRA